MSKYILFFPTNRFTSRKKIQAKITIITIFLNRPVYGALICEESSLPINLSEKSPIYRI